MQDLFFSAIEKIARANISRNKLIHRESKTKTLDSNPNSDPKSKPDLKRAATLPAEY